MTEGRKKEPWKRPHNHNTNRGRASLNDKRKNVEFAYNSGNWREGAACRGMDVNMFFPEKGGQGTVTTKKAKAICASCPVQEHCLSFALEADERIGIYGGTSERQRRALSDRINLAQRMQR
jgi:WhiB family redox-sensing transcriptional regulator